MENSQNYVLIRNKSNKAQFCFISKKVKDLSSDLTKNKLKIPSFCDDLSKSFVYQTLISITLLSYYPFHCFFFYFNDVYIDKCLCVGMSPFMLVRREARRWLWIPWNRYYRQVVSQQTESAGN